MARISLAVLLIAVATAQVALARSSYYPQKVHCPELEAPKYGQIRVRGYSPSSLAYYSCDNGYSLYGLKVRKCLHDGTWHGNAPTCRQQRRNCHKLDAPEYGKVSVNGYGCYSTAYYSCNYGYELDGSYSRQCQRNGTWAGKAPECRKAKRNNCPGLDAPEYGKVSVTGYGYSSTAYYTCNHGYELHGSYSRKCQHDGTWYGNAPECRPAKRVNCNKLDTPQYGQVWLTGNSYSSTAYYRCNYGYELHGSHSRKCQHDGTWAGNAPECRKAKRVNCRQLDDPRYGKVIVTGYSYSSRAYYSCDYGYELHGSYLRQCQHDGTWAGKAPECRHARRVNCTKLDAPEYGQVWVTGYGYSSTAYYRCNYGYELHGAHSRNCQHDGSWYGKAPECRPVKRVICSKLDAPRYGKVSVTGYGYSSTAYYTCNYGYQLHGSYSRKCQHDGTWAGKAPECRHARRVNCTKLDAPEYGQVWVTGYGYSSAAYYRCNYGYELHGVHSRNCQHDGSWYGKAPECRPVKRVICSKLDAPRYGKVSVTGYGYSSTAYYTCSYGYQLHGSYSRKCQHDGTWAGKAPECREATRVNCPGLDAPKYGTVIVTGYGYTSAAYYRCNYGYELHGAHSRKCQHDGTWAGKAPECRKARTVACSKLDAPKYGKVWVTGNSYSSTAYYSCNYGYELQGSYSRKCQHDGTWAGKAPECRKAKRVTCPNLDKIPYGTVIVTGYGYSSTAYYTCNHGYDLHGSYSRKCQHDGTWYGNVPECRKAKPVTCSKLVAPRYGRVWVTSNAYSSTAYYSCNYGYELQGSYSRKCQHDGTWAGKAPECRQAKRVICPNLDEIPYGTVIVTGYGYSSTAYYRCNHGYELHGSHSRKCQHDGTWYGNAPGCRKAKSVICSKLDAPRYGRVWVTSNAYSSTAYYTCNYGYELHGSNSRKCQHDGTWAGKAPECRKAKSVTCPELDELPYGRVIVTGYGYSSTAYYSCKYGYELNGSHSRKCQHDGTWAGKAPECRKAEGVNCPKVVAPRYGKVWVTGNSYSSTAYYTCDYGYDLHGSYSRKCQHDRTWAGKAPECRQAKRVTCPELDKLPYGQVWVTGYGYSSTAYYRCSYGYELHGSYSRKCQHDGSWYGKAPACRPVKRVKCSELDAPEYGRVSVNGYGYSSTAYYTCKYGYELDGSYSRKCQHDGTWYGKAPTCRKVIRDCPELDHPTNGKVVVKGNTPGSVAYYKCDYGYKLHGSSYRKCLHDGSWYGNAPTCHRNKY